MNQSALKSLTGRSRKLPVCGSKARRAGSVSDRSDLLPSLTLPARRFLLVSLTSAMLAKEPLDRSQRNAVFVPRAVNRPAYGKGNSHQSAVRVEHAGPAVRRLDV